jgi:hypothetical protein
MAASIVDAQAALTAAVTKLRAAVNALDESSRTIAPASFPADVQLDALCVLDWAQESYNEAGRAILAARTLLAAADAAVSAKAAV